MLLGTIAVLLVISQPNQELVDLARMVEESYDSKSVIEARVEQESYWVNLDERVSSSAKLWLGKGGAIRLEYETGGRVVSDGDTIWVYVPESEQVFISRADTSSLLNPARLVTHFTQKSDSIHFDRRDDGWLAEFRMKPGGKFAFLSAAIRDEDYMVPELFMRDAEGNETKIKLEYARHGLATRQLFEFSKPNGAEVIRN